jgi:hypothetical protein
MGLHSIAARVDCRWPSTISEINIHKRIVKAGEGDVWAQCSSQGKGISDFKRDKEGNSWLSHPLLLSEGQYVEALKLRSNTSGVRVNMISSGLGTARSPCVEIAHCAPRRKRTSWGSVSPQSQ